VESSWSEGYVVDVGYTHGFYRELTPALLRFVTLLGGVQAASIEAPFSYCELGCGNGYTTALLAAANPHGQFTGVDFNPTHIHHAQQLAQSGGVGNVRFLEKSFAELVGMDLPEADVITLHGIWSWVSEENRRHIVEFIRRRLKPGGIVYVSYNCLPGLAQVQPLQRLLYEHAAGGAGERMDKVRRSLDFAARLAAAGADYFRLNPLGRLRLENIGKHDPSYVAHEYYNASWAPFYHLEVARSLGEAKLAYAGSATLADNFDQFSIGPEAAKLLAEVGDRALAETLKDFVRNQVFRRDVFTRGAPRAPGPQLESALARTRFALARPRSAARFKEKTPHGELSLQEPAYAPALDALARAPMTFDELAHAPEAASLDRVRLRQAVFGMAAFGNLMPALPAQGEAERRAATDGFNAAVLGRPLDGSKTTMLASPVLGSGVPIGFLDRIFLRGPANEGEAIDHARRAIESGGLGIVKSGKPVDSAAERDKVLVERAQFFFGELLPFLRMLGVVA
jgi:SAM-dependent methyltransferase